QCELRDLRRLNRKTAETDPALCSVDRREKENCDQHQRSYSQNCENDAAVIQNSIIETADDEHQRDADKRERQLLIEIPVLARLLAFPESDHRRRAEYHQRAEERKARR